MASRSKKLRSGYTTGACAAAAAKAAVLLLMRTASRVSGNGLQAGCPAVTHHSLSVTEVEIPFPDGSRHTFSIQQSAVSYQHESTIATASVIKDAGDDPDITNGAEIVAEVRLLSRNNGQIIIRGGKGLGTVTKPGLAVPVGEPAINPVPRRMIREAVGEAITENVLPAEHGIEITISVPNGEELATKTLNARLGIIGGISILGTTGIVRPLSAEAWTASITASMDVAKATGCDEVVLSAGRVSEKAHMERYGLPVEAYVMMGDYVEFSLLDAGRHAFRKIHLSAHWAKMLKIAMEIPQTHVRHGAIDLKKAAEFLNNISSGLLDASHDYNTAREMYDLICSRPGARNSGLFSEVCRRAKEYAEGIVKGIPVSAHLVSYEGEIIAQDE